MKAFLSVFLIATLVPAFALADSKKKHKASAATTSSAPAAEEHKAASKPAPADTEERSGAVAGEPDTDGCGLGWQVTSSKTIIGSITRGTTNGTIPPSFGMTSGTLGCRKHPFTKRDQAGAVYAVSNFDQLRIEMAEGRGEVLEGFARTIGCDDAAAFGQMTQKNYRAITEKASAVRMFLNVKNMGCGA
ncbi:MAG: DUF3015 family protein [Deltaproteobacteria bacterium]|nr:DUF3015 family protein [Deltaproteobacteria bacterium]